MQDTLNSGKSSVHRPMFAGFRAYIWLFVCMFALYLIFSPFVTLFGSSSSPWSSTTPYDGDTKVTLGMALLLLSLVCAAAILVSRRQMTSGKFIFLIVLAGFVLRFGYMLNTPFYVRGHDVMTLNGYGHLAYVYRLFSLWELPLTNLGQFYHPPLAHAADAAVAKVYALLTGARSLDTIFESARLVPCFASCALLIMTSRLFDTLEFSKRAKIIALSVVSFHPTFILLSASINNDMLMIFFFMAAFLYTIRWYRNPTYKNILILALCIGCAMSTKFSGALIAVFTAMVFLVVLARRIKDKTPADIVCQFAAFAAVCLPLGLWYHIRNLKLFDQHLGYVAEIPATSALYTGNKTFAERFLTFSLPDMLKHVYCNPWDDFRLWEYTVKCALFGEFTFSPGHDVMARFLIVSSLVLIVISLIAMIWFLLFSGKRNRLAVLSFFIVWVLLMLSFVYFNMKFPFGCTMDFRYIVPTVIIGATFLGFMSDKLSGSPVKDALFTALGGVIAVFCVSSAVFYII